MAALAEALVEAGFRHATVVPGDPATALQDALQAAGVEVLDVGNERTALEMAFGWSLGGRPALAVIKGNGGWLAGEPLQNMAVHGIRAPLLVLIGDDVVARSSTVPTDVRTLGTAAAVPVLDLRADSAARGLMAVVAAASSSSGRPVVVRFTGSLATSACDVGAADLVPEGAFPPAQPLEPHRLTKFSRFLESEARWAADETAVWGRLVPVERLGGGSTGVVASGRGWDVVAQHLGSHDVAALGIELVHPFPAAQVASFCARLSRVVVVEEGRPLVEDLVHAAVVRAGLDCEVLGQRTGHVPVLGAGVELDLSGVVADPSPPRARPSRSQPHPPAGPTTFDPVLRSLALVVGRTGATLHTCVGSSIAAAYAPHGIAMSSLELGAAIAVAAGAATATGSPAIAVVGDYGLVHSALEDHDLVHRCSWPVLTVVLADGVSGKTGGQRMATASDVAVGRPLDLERILTRTADASRVEVLELDELSEEAFATHLQGLMADLPQTVVVLAGQRVFRPQRHHPVGEA